MCIVYLGRDSLDIDAKDVNILVEGSVVCIETIIYSYIVNHREHVLAGRLTKMTLKVNV